MVLLLNGKILIGIIKDKPFFAYNGLVNRHSEGFIKINE